LKFTKDNEYLVGYFAIADIANWSWAGVSIEEFPNSQKLLK